MALAVVARMPSLVEAQIAAGALRSGGIAAEVFDGNFGQVELPVIEALGGYRIMAPAEEAARAQQLLRLLQASPGLGEPGEESPWRPRPARPTRLWRAVALGLFLATAIWLLRQFLG